MKFWNMERITASKNALRILFVLSATLIFYLFNPITSATSKDNQIMPANDFQVTLVSAGLGIYRFERESVTISANGSGEYLSGSNIADDNSIKKQETFTLTRSAISRIHQAIEKHQFNALKAEYRRNRKVHDGDLAEITVRQNGKSKTVRTYNKAIDDFDAIARLINNELPEEFRIMYNAIREF